VSGVFLVDEFEPIEIGERGARIDVGLVSGRGDSGTPGASAYQVWLDEGNVGTVDDFLELLTYDAWLAAGNVGTIGDFILDITGPAGTNGTNGTNGAAGRGIVSVVRTSGTGAPGTTDTYTITYTSGSPSTFDVYNGANGTGSGDVVGPAGATADRIVVWDGITGKLVKVGSVTIADLLTTAAAPELIRDTIAAALQQGANITVTVNDGADTITIAATGLAKSTQGGAEDIFTFSGTTGTVTGDISTGSVAELTPTGTVTLAFTGLPASKACSITVILVQGGTLRTVNPPTGTVVGAIPTMVINKTYRIELMTLNAGSKWYIGGGPL
jgi:hypothetical protein